MLSSFKKQHQNPSRNSIRIQFPGSTKPGTHQAMARAYLHWAKVGLYDNPSGWVYRVGMNRATSWLRRRRRHAGRAGTEAWEDRAPFDPDLREALLHPCVRRSFTSASYSARRSCCGIYWISAKLRSRKFWACHSER